MVCLRGLAILLLFPSGGARRSIRLDNSHRGLQQESGTLAHGLDVSDQLQQAFVPGAGALSEAFVPGAGALSEELTQHGWRAGQVWRHRASGHGEGQLSPRWGPLPTAHRFQRARAPAMMAKLKKSKNVQVILKETVENVGKAGEVASVKHSYAENVLLPQGLVAVASPEALQKIRDEVAAKEAAAAALKEEATQKAEALSRTFGDSGCFVEKKVGPDGAIFGSVTPAELAVIIDSQAGLFVDKKNITVPEIQKEDEITIPAQKPGGSSTKVAGTAIASIKLHPEVVCTIKVLVVPK